MLLVLINLLASRYFFRADLTEEKRYSIKPQTRGMLNKLDDVVYIEVYLEGDLNAGFRRFQKKHTRNAGGIPHLFRQQGAL